MMTPSDPYQSAHLIVAAIRILEHRHKVPPAMEAVCDLLSISLEEGLRICRRLRDGKVIDILDAAEGSKLCIHDHLAIEEIPRTESGPSLEKELEKFQSTRRDLTRKIESFQARKAKEKKDLFAEIEKQLKKGGDGKVPVDKDRGGG